MCQVNSEFQAFKHIEVLSPGELQRASEPLEATLAILPTLILTNALPYYMEVIVWQVLPLQVPIHASLLLASVLVAILSALKCGS